MDAAHQFHDEVGPARLRRARIEHLGDVRMVHQRQRLPLGFEAGDDLPGVHAQLDDLERDAAPHRLLLLGHVDHAAAAFADLLQQLVAADLVARLLRHLPEKSRSPRPDTRPGVAFKPRIVQGRFLEKGPDLLVLVKQFLDPSTQSRVPAASTLQVTRALHLRFDFQRA